LPRVREELESLIIRKKLVIPIIYEGKEYHLDPEDYVRHSKDDLIVNDKDQEIEIYYALHKHGGSIFEEDDDIRIDLRRMPVELGRMYHILVFEGGSKLPQNYIHNSIPYANDESCLVFSQNAEPTIGRDKLVRDTEFNKIKSRVVKARVKALIRLLKEGMNNEYARSAVFANIYTLRTPIKSYLMGSSFGDTDQFLLSLMDELVKYPAFEIFGHGNTKLSIRDILDASPPGGVYFSAETPEASNFLTGQHQASFILKEHTLAFDSFWGGHNQKCVQDCLKPVIEAIDENELLALESLMHDEEKLQELEEKGIIKRKPIKYRFVEEPGEDMEDFLSNLRSILNRRWFRKSIISESKELKHIYLKAIETVDGEELVACLLNFENRELTIGINISSSVIQYLKRHNTGHFFFLSTLCHELSHRRRKIIGPDGIPHDSIHFHTIRLHLEDRVLAACASYLTGQDGNLGVDDTDDDGVLVL